MFSTKHSFSASQIVTPLFYTHSNIPLFGRRGAVFGTYHPNLVDISGPDKKLPPAKKKKFPRHPPGSSAPAPSWKPPPPFLGFSIKNPSPPPSAAQTPHSPSPSRKHNKKYPNHPPRKLTNLPMFVAFLCFFFENLKKPQSDKGPKQLCAPKS